MKTALTIAAFLACAAGIAAYALRSPAGEEAQERHRMRVVVPSVAGAGERSGDGRQAAAAPERPAHESAYILKAPMGSGELVISVLNFDFGNSGVEDQVVAFRAPQDNGNGAESPVSIAFFSFSERAGGHARMWDLPTSATVPGTVSLFAMDLLGDRGSVVIVTGMNDKNEHTMTAFRRNPSPSRPFDVIADISIDGSVAVRETPRSLAYQQGVARGQPFDIIASGRDPESDNILDRIELTYSFSAASGAYRRARSVRIPGAQVEQDRVRQILSGAPGAFEGFISDIWYYVTREGAIDRSQFIFFDPARREIVFFGEESQQIYVWQSSNATRQGILISSYNRAVTAMRRRVSIELESMDSIRVTVADDRRQRIGVSPPWTGSYRRAGAVLRAMAGESLAMAPGKDATFDSPLGRLRFLPCGEYELAAPGSVSRGRYVFFRAGGMDLLELRPDQGGGGALWALGGEPGSPDGRHVFRVDGVARNARGQPPAAVDYMGLSRVRLGVSGAQELHEARIVLTRAEQAPR